MSQPAVPFGLLFLQREVTCDQLPLRTYDEERDVSVLQANGESVPLVSAVDSRMSTETVTEVAGEATDEPLQSVTRAWSLGVETETKAQDDITLWPLEPHLVMPQATET